MTELLPCPFCGGQPDFQHFNITPNVKGRIICSCGIELRQGEYDTEDDLRIIWNTRSDYRTQRENELRVERREAERTCCIEHVKKGALYDVWRCSSCGYEYAESVSEPSMIQNYCPNCGRKVSA